MDPNKYFEVDDTAFSALAYGVRGWPGNAVAALGWEVEYDGNGQMVRTGHIVVTIVGDDTHHLVDEGELTLIDREDFCGVCGQIGGRDGCDHESNEFDREEVYKKWREQ